MPTQSLPAPVETTQQDKTQNDSAPFLQPVYSPNGGYSPARNGVRPFAQSLDWDALEVLEADLVEEDDEPVDGIFSEKQQRISTHTLYESWPGPGDGRPFVAMANVGLFYDILEPPIVPDALLSVGISLLANIHLPGHRSYTYWRYNKPPEVAIELVSNRKGNEKDKKDIYAKAKVLYYLIFDRYQELGGPMMYVYRRNEDGEYDEYAAQGAVWWFPEINLGVRLWEGEYEHMFDTWLRWCYEDGRVVPTGEEMAHYERSEKERERSEKERALQKAERLAAKLRELGIDPDA